MARDSQTPSIPEWQRQEAIAATPATESKQPEKSQEDPISVGSDSPPSRTSLLEQAAAFLEHDDICEASTDRKISFLESKGLNNDEIQQLLGISRNTSASSPSAPTTADTISNLSPNPKTPAPRLDTELPGSSAPPIITYPEFLLHASRPTALVTTSRLLTTFYATVATAATLHAAHNYLFNPMLESLTAARHSLFDTTTQHLETLNDKLLANVSEVPKAARPKKSPKDEERDDNDSEASDPAELFHVDAAVQTDNSNTAELLGHDFVERTSLPTIGKHTDRLQVLRKHVENCDETAENVSNARQGARDEVRALMEYLQDIQFGSRGKVASSWEIKPYSLRNVEQGGPPGEAAFNPNPALGARGKEGEEEEVDKLRKEIRGIKGVLLSASSFPRGGNRTTLPNTETRKTGATTASWADPRRRWAPEQETVRGAQAKPIDMDKLRARKEELDRALGRIP